MAIDTLMQQLKQADDARPSFPGEHWLAFGAGMALFLWAGGRRSALVRSLARTAATGLVARAVSGRDGLRRVAR